MEGIGIGKKSELPLPLQEENDFLDLPVFCEDVVPDRDKLFKRERELKRFFEGQEEFDRRNLSLIETVNHAFLEIKEVKEDSLGILESFFPREPGEFLGDLEMTERKDDIAQIKKNDFGHEKS